MKVPESILQARSQIQSGQIREGWNQLKSFFKAPDIQLRACAYYDAALFLESRGEFSKARMLLQKLLKHSPQFPLQRYVQLWIERLSSPDSKEQVQFDQALTQLDQNPKQGLKELFRFTREFPDSVLADNALLWAAEQSLEIDEALCEKVVLRLTQNYPNSDGCLSLKADTRFSAILAKTSG